MDKTKIGAVVIGRNEGERLKRCLESLSDAVGALVYVDSGSVDGSQEFARSQKAEVISLDLSSPFTAARARNEGFKKLIEIWPDTEHVQFIDGDCLVAEGWLDTAVEFLSNNPQAAIICGIRKEIHPKDSIYNTLCDIEWNGPKGSIKKCGGDFMIRTNVMESSGGFNDSLIAGEEPELCYRIRSLGWEVHRVDKEMTHHDANILKLSQWWKRNLRSGHAYINVAHLHHSSLEKICQRETASNLAWGFFFPGSILALSILISPILLASFLLYLYLFKKCFSSAKISQGICRKIASYYAFFIVLGKFPQAFGALTYIYRCLINNRHTIIEYK